jgi:hypothetical protein
MSTDGIQQQYIPASLDGLVYVDVDGLTVNGVPVDLDNLVPYTNATKNLNLGTFNFETLGNVSAKQHIFPSFPSTLMTGAMTSSIFTADAWGFANTISTVSLSPTVTTSYLTLSNLINNSTIVTFQNDGIANFGSTIVRTSHMASNVYDVVNLSTLQASNAFIENVNALNFVKYVGSTDDLDMGASTIKTTGLIHAGALRITSSISNTDYSISVNGTDYLEFTNLTSLQKVYTDGDSIWIPNRIFCNSTIYTNDLQMGNTIYFSYGTGQQWGTTINGSAEYEIQDDLGAMRLRLSKSTGLTVSTLNITNVPSATPTLALGVNGSGGVVSFAVPSGASFPFTGTTNINGGLQTIQNATQFNPSLDANSYFVTGVFPTTYVFTTNWTVNPVSGTEANVALDPAVFYFDTNHKYIISFTGIYGTGATWVGTVFNSSTATTVSDASIAITTSPQNLSITFTAGSSNPSIYLRFVGSSGTLRFTNFTIKEVDLQIMGNVALSSEIDSNIVQSNGRTANVANALRVNQTSVATAPTLTTASLPAGVSASSLSGSYTLTATAGGATFGMWLGSSFTYMAGAKYTFTFTGFSTNATATQAMIMYVNTYTGGSGTFIGDYIVNVPITSSTVSGSFTATSNNNVVFNFISSAAGRSISFTGFTLTRADTQITGIATLPTNTGTIVAGLGLNSSNQIVSYSASGAPNFSAVTVGSVPYESAVDTFSNSLITQGTNSLGYSGGSFTASTGIGSITYSAPTYTANSSASFQGIINLSTLPNYALNTSCIAQFTALSFPLFAVAPYPYFTLTCGATVVYTSAVGASGTITMPFTPTSTTLFVTIYFKAPGTGVTVPVLTWTNFTISTPAMTTTGTSLVNGIANIHAGSPVAVPNGFMSAGSLTIGDVTRNYGGGTTTWNNNTAGLLFECLDNTEIAVHDAGARVASMMRYNANTLTMGRDMGWGTSNVATAGNFTVSGTTTTLGNRLLGTTDASPTGNFWIGLNGSGSEGDRLAIALTGTQATGVVSLINLNKNTVATGNFTVNVDFRKEGGNSGANWFSIRGTDPNNSPYLEFFTANVRRCYIGYASTGQVDFMGENGAQLMFGTQSVPRMIITTAGDVNVTNNLTGACLVVTSGGTYQAGCLYSDTNWGMLIRGRVPGAVAEFDFRNSAEAVRMRITPDGRVNIANRLTVGGANSQGVIDIVNPNGTYTHLGWTDNQNYIRGVNTIMDTPVTLSTAGGAGGTPRIQSGNTNRSMRYDDGNLVTWLLNNAGSSPIPFTHSSWGAGSGGGYTVIARSEGVTQMGLGFGVSTAGAYRSVIISLAPAIIWGELILSGGTIYTSCNGTINLYTAGGGWIFVSDQRCKRDIKDIKTTRSLERIMALKPKTYKKIYPENPETPISDKVRDADHIGFLAQDVMDSNPHCIDEWVDDKCVCDDDDGKRLGIAYGDINVHMVGAIQELKKQNDAQQKEIDELKEMVKALMEKLK